MTQDIVSLIVDIFHRRGAESYLGEQVSMSAHMLQAAQQAEQAGADDILVAASLLHDIGHYTNEFPDDAQERGIDAHHEDAGARVLKGHFPERLIACVKNHVAAKRYLCATEPGYFDRLSPASVHTLNLQGGPMDMKAVKEFGAHPNLQDILSVRRWDEAAKIAGLKTKTIEDYIPLLKSVVQITG